MHRILVVGSGPDVGKTVVSAILTVLFNGEYWKPIQCGDESTSDTVIVKTWLDGTKQIIHPPAYSFKTPVSPHHAARLENTSISLDSIIVPRTTRPLIIESTGGIFSPLTIRSLPIDLFQSWNCQWVVVSRHYLGSINHTLLTINALKQRQLPIMGLIFNGDPNPDSEAAIMQTSQIPLLGRLLPESHLDVETIHQYANQWKPCFSKHLL